jgi:uncharacterized protein YbjT (DUF2867 family)
MTRILITGATGMIGGEIAHQLQQRGEPIRVLVRDATKFLWASKAVDITIGDFATIESLDAALNGVERLFLASFDRPDQPSLQRNVLTAAKRQGVRHVVRMSTMAVHEKPHIPIFAWHSVSERQLEESGLAFTHLRPSWVMQNFFSFVAGDKIRLPSGDGRVGFVDARDIAAVAVEALTGPGHEGKAYELTGPEALSHSDVADRLSVAVGRPISYENIAPEIYEQEKLEQGWPRTSIDSLLGLFAEMRAGTNPDSGVTSTVESVTSRAPLNFQKFARDYAARFGPGS